MRTVHTSRRQLLRAGGAGLLAVAGVGAADASSTSSADESPPPPVWTFETGGEVLSSPTVVGDTAFVGSADGSVYALDSATGEQSWAVSFDDAISETVSPTVVDGLLASGTARETRVLSAATGDTIWGADRGLSSPATVADGQVLLAENTLGVLQQESSGSVRAHHAGSGRTAWVFGGDSGDRFSSPVVVDGTVYVGNGNDSLHAVDAATGEQAWVADTESGAAVAPAVADGTVYATDDEGRLYAFAASDGTDIWTVDLLSDPAFEMGQRSVPTVAAGTVFGRLHFGPTARDRLYAVDAQSGEISWTVDIDELLAGGTTFSFFDAVSAPTVAGGVVFVGSLDGRVYGFSVGDGEQVWSFETGDAVRSSPTVVDGTVYVGSDDENVYALDAPVGESSSCSRVRLGTLGHHGEWADQAPTALFDYDTDNPGPGEAVTFDATLTSGDIETHEWSFGDEESTGVTATHAFETGGIRDVTLTVTDADGETATATQQVSVHPPVAWQFDTDDPVRSSPTVVDGTVYVGSDDENLYALDAETGVERWSDTASGPVDTAPAAVEDTVYARAPHESGATELYAVEADTGERRWTAEIRAATTSSPTVADATVYLGLGVRIAIEYGGSGSGPGSRNGVCALDAEDGARRWFRSTDQAVTVSPTVVDGRVYVGTSGFDEPSEVLALDAGTGADDWRATVEQPVTASPTVADGTLVVGAGSPLPFLADDEGAVIAFDAETGQQRWHRDTDRPVRASPTIADGTVYVGTGERVCAFDADTGETVWTADTASTVRSSPTVAGEAVVVGDSGGTLYAFDVTTGRRRWTFEPGGDIQSSPTVVDGTVYVGVEEATEEGSVYALTLSEGASSEGSRVRLGTLGHHGEWADQTPTAMFTFDTRRLVVGESVTVDAAPTTGSIASYTWDVTDDGVTDTTGQTTTHTPEESGRHWIRLTATTVDGETTERRRPLSVQPSQRWRFESTSPMASSPTAVDGSVYVGNDDGLQLLDAENGDPLGTHETDHSVSAAPTVVDGIAFVGTRSEEVPLYAMDPETGERYWEAALDGEINASPTVVDRVVYVGTLSGTVYALAAASGGVLWSEAVGDVWGSPVVAGSTVYVGSFPRRVYALDTLDGSRRWQYRTDGSVFSSVTVAAGRVFAGTDDGTLYALDSTTGDEGWSFETGDSIFAAPTVADGRVYAGTDDGHLYALDAETGAQSWAVPTAGPVVSAPMVAGGRVYVGTDEGTLHALDSATGIREWTIDTDDGIQSSPTVADGSLYVGTEAGTVYALDVAGDGSGVGSRGELGTHGHHGDWRHADQSLDVVAGSGDGGDDQSGDGGDDSDDGFGPGLGAKTALAGLGGVGSLLAWRLRSGNSGETAGHDDTGRDVDGS